MAALLLVATGMPWSGRNEDAPARRVVVAAPAEASRAALAAASPSYARPASLARSGVSPTALFDEAAWAARWRDLVAPSDAGVDGGGRELRILGLLEELAAHDPLRALEMSGVAAGHAARLRWRGAVLRRWAQTDPHAAADWVARHLGAQPDARDAALSAVIDGAAAQAAPDVALALLRSLEIEDPAGAEARRGELVAAWARHGAFEAAAAFASGARAGERADLLDAAFGAWVRQRPAQAARVALDLRDGGAREQAWRSVVAGWAIEDPAALARFAVDLPQARARAEALEQALPHWFLRDSGAATAWMDDSAPSPELDSGAACVASFAPLVMLRPDVALGWAEGIVNPELRRAVLCDVVQTWSQKDPEAARRYAIRHGLPALDL